MKGLAIIIDVFRAFSLECYLFASGADEIIAASLVNADAVAKYIFSRNLAAV